MARWQDLSGAAIIAALIGATTPCAAQSGATAEGNGLEHFVGTIAVKFTPVFGGGQLSGCTLEYNVLVRDWVYRQGAFSKVTGSFGFLTTNAGIIPVLKIVVHDIEGATLGLQPAAPVRAFIAAGLETNANSITGQSPSDAPGALFVVFRADPTTAMLLDALEKGNIQLRFARDATGVDVPVDVDLQVSNISDEGKRTYSPEAVSTMLQCVQRLLSGK